VDVFLVEGRAHLHGPLQPVPTTAGPRLIAIVFQCLRPGKFKDGLQIHVLRVVIGRPHDEPYPVEKSGQGHVIQQGDENTSRRLGDVMHDRQMRREKSHAGQGTRQQFRRLDSPGANRQQQRESAGEHHRQCIGPQRGEKQLRRLRQQPAQG
jgi:hypothetical protein